MPDNQKLFIVQDGAKESAAAQMQVQHSFRHLLPKMQNLVYRLFLLTPSLSDTSVHQILVFVMSGHRTRLLCKMKVEEVRRDRLRSGQL